MFSCLLSLSPFISLHFSLSLLHARLTCWQALVNRYQFAVSETRGMCGNHFHLSTVGRHLSLSLTMPADTCHWVAVRQKGCVGAGSTGHAPFSPKAAPAKTLSGVLATCTVTADTLHFYNEKTTRAAANSITSPLWPCLPICASLCLCV